MDGGKYREYPVEMDLNKTEMLLLLSVRYLKIAERLTVCVKQARNLLLHDKKGKLGMLPWELKFPLFFTVIMCINSCNSERASFFFIK